LLSEQGNLTQETVETALANAGKSGLHPPRYRVGDILIDAGLVTRKQVEEVRARQDSEKHKRLGTIMVESGRISEDQLLNALARKFDLRVIDLDDIQIAPEVMLGIIAQRLVRRLCNQCVTVNPAHLARCSAMRHSSAGRPANDPAAAHRSAWLGDS
jgi:hypothetical protein